MLYQNGNTIFHNKISLPHICEGWFVPTPAVTQEHLVASDAAMVQVGKVVGLSSLYTGVPLGHLFPQGLVDHRDIRDGVLFVGGFDGRFVRELFQGEGVFR